MPGRCAVNLAIKIRIASLYHTLDTAIGRKFFAKVGSLPGLGMADNRLSKMASQSGALTHALNSFNNSSHSTGASIRHLIADTGMPNTPGLAYVDMPLSAVWNSSMVMSASNELDASSGNV